MGHAAKKQEHADARQPLLREWYDTAQAAEYLSTTVNAVYKLVERGHLKPDVLAGTGRVRGHRFRYATLARFLGGQGG